MKNLVKSLSVAAALSLGAASANAGVIDFIALTQGAGGLGETAWNPLVISTGGATATITGHATNDNDPTQYAYLDWGNAGLGVCKDVINANKVNTSATGSKVNNCAPGSDDNTTVGEYLSFVFDKNVLIENLWFNNNHDGGFGAGDKVNIAGTDYNVATGYAGGANGIGSFYVQAGTAFLVAYANEEFYMSGISFSQAVPAPGTGAIALLGLAMLGLRRRHGA